jgi:phospho-N-acetylmuramoyl-pentapeptide-transferase
VIKRLRQMQVGQFIREDGPQTHYKKSGTPTMGGVLIIGAVTAATLLWANLTQFLYLGPLLVVIGYGLIGFADDYLMQVKKQSKGSLGAKEKFCCRLWSGNPLWLLLF